MAANDSVANSLDELPYDQLAVSQASRTAFTPGKATSVAGDENWPTAFRVPVGLSQFESAGPLEKTFERVSLVGRNTVCDDTLTDVPAAPEDTTQENDGRKERQSGFNWADGA